MVVVGIRRVFVGLDVLQKPLKELIVVAAYYAHLKPRYPRRDVCKKLGCLFYLALYFLILL